MRVLLICVLTGFFCPAAAQDSTSKQSSQRKTRFGISAGLAFTDAVYKSYYPHLSYQAGAYGITRFKKSSLQYGLQYFPFGSSFKAVDGETYRFVNHFLNFSALSKMSFRRLQQLSFDAGASFGWVMSHQTDYVDRDLTAVCDCYQLATPMNIEWQMFIQTGFSWELPKNNRVSLTTVMSTRLVKAEYWYPFYYLLQGSFSHTF
jgi:hypothetical protein